MAERLGASLQSSKRRFDPALPLLLLRDGSPAGLPSSSWPVVILTRVRDSVGSHQVARFAQRLVDRYGLEGAALVSGVSTGTINNILRGTTRTVQRLTAVKLVRAALLTVRQDGGAHELTATRDCAVQTCLAEAEPGAVFCRRHKHLT